ncbi:MAG TPA: type II toxin-antitoxin system VapC family toxin [Candidatus Brocadiales bacterium]|nr:type II toxin-antitoxin system VapC family toxin [Candidatus Brocadiales bacterium]
MVRTKVLDSWALMCYLEQEPGFEKVIELLDEATGSSKPLLMCVVNWGEIYYQVARRLGETKAQEIERLIQSFPIKLIEADIDLTREAARFKATKHIAYADCFAAALARQKKAELYTGDPEFRALEKDIKVVWL